MLYWLTAYSDQWQALNLFRYLTFRTGGALITSAFIVFLFGPRIIARLNGIDPERPYFDPLVVEEAIGRHARLIGFQDVSFTWTMGPQLRPEALAPTRPTRNGSVMVFSLPPVCIGRGAGRSQLLQPVCAARCQSARSRTTTGMRRSVLVSYSAN